MNFLNYSKTISQYFSASLIPMILNLAINPLVSIAMEPEDFAIVGYFSSFNTLITPIVIFYMLHYYNKRYFELHEEERTNLKALLFKALIFFSALISLVCLLFLWIYIRYFTSNSFSCFPYLLMTVLAIPLTGIYSLELADLKMKRNSRKYMHFSLYKGLYGVLATIIFVIVFRMGAFGKLLGPILVDLGFFIFLLKKYKEFWRITTPISELIPVLKFCSPLVVGASLGYFCNGYDKAVLERLGDVREFGYYCVGTSIATYLGLFTTSISSTFQPDIYEAIIKDNRTKLFKVTALRWGLTFAVVLLFVVFCPFVIKILTAGKYIEATNYARIFACVSLTNCIYYIINDYSIARNKPYYYTITTIIGSLSIIILMPYAVDKWSFVGAAVMMVVSFLILSIINVSLFGIEFVVMKVLRRNNVS